MFRGWFFAGSVFVRCNCWLFISISINSCKPKKLVVWPLVLLVPQSSYTYLFLSTVVHAMFPVCTLQFMCISMLKFLLSILYWVHMLFVLLSYIPVIMCTSDSYGFLIPLSFYRDFPANHRKGLLLLVGTFWLLLDLQVVFLSVFVSIASRNCWILHLHHASMVKLIVLHFQIFLFFCSILGSPVLLSRN